MFRSMRLPFWLLSLRQGAEQVPGETDEGDDEEGIGGAFLSVLNLCLC